MTPRRLRYAKARDELAGQLARFLASEGRRLAADVVAQLPQPSAPSAIVKAEGGSSRDQARGIAGGLDFGGWSVLVGMVEGAAAPVMERQAAAALAQVGVGDDRDALLRANVRAVAWAKERAAEMVGMTRLPDGRLVPNPRAEWAITESTRTAIQDEIVRALDEGMSPGALADAIQEHGAFSELRADVIARTELALANMEAAQLGWAESGVVQSKVWLLSDDHDHVDECDENADGGEVPLAAAFPSGDLHPPAHPYCQCDVAAVVAEEAES